MDLTSKQQRWYVLQVMSGHERKVKRSLEEMLEKSPEVKESVFEVFLPTEKVSEVKGGKQIIREKNLWPGYLLVRMEMSEVAWHFICDLDGVVSFLGGETPTPLSSIEVEEILKNLQSKREEIVHKYDLRVGDQVKIVNGVFENFTGTVVEIFQDKGCLSVLVSIFGRETRVDELQFWQVEKIVND